MGINDLKLNDRIAELEAELKKTKYNKRTQNSVGLLKAKIARMRDEKHKKASTKLAVDTFAVRKTGDATAVLIGFPSAGKSTLLNVLSSAKSQVAAYAFTTLNVIPGILQYKKTRIQVLDVPGLIEGASRGKGRGREVIAAASSADLIILLVDAIHPEQLNVMRAELYNARIRMNVRKPEIKIVKKSTGGISLAGTFTRMDRDTAIALLRELKISNADVIMRQDLSAEEMIDAVEGNRKYVPGIIVVNKADLLDESAKERIKVIVNPDIFISAEKAEGIDEMKELIFQRLELVRVYCKEVGKPADMSEPIVLKKGATLKIVCEKLHRGFVKRFRFARIWGKSVKFAGQKVLKLEHEVADEDVVEVHVS
ncbi:MAG: 50S ribosome-binding GTPase [Nanoarchaeota archaeon]|nr:50S ribosome-binding GTPase [Nanoarchaeota archaeon]